MMHSATSFHIRLGVSHSSRSRHSFILECLKAWELHAPRKMAVDAEKPRIPRRMTLHCSKLQLVFLRPADAISRVQNCVSILVEDQDLDLVQNDSESG